MIRFVSVIGALVALAAAVVLIIGYLTPANYEGEISEFFIDRRPIIWQAMTNVEAIPKIKPDVENIEILVNNRGLITWRENLQRNKFRTFRIVEKREPYKYVVDLFDSSNGVTGTYTFLLSQTQNGTIVKIEEESEIKNLWVRGWHTILGGEVRLRHEMKTLRVALFRRLIDTP